MIWRKEPPDKAGWWWVMDAHEKVACIVVREFSDPDFSGPVFFTPGTEDYHWVRPESLGYVAFAGPIPEPTWATTEPTLAERLSDIIEG